MPGPDLPAPAALATLPLHDPDSPGGVRDSVRYLADLDWLMLTVENVAPGSASVPKPGS
jgi:hypothetical protein